MPNAGEKPGEGSYTCSGCGETVKLDSSEDSLPPCPSCNGTEYKS